MIKSFIKDIFPKYKREKSPLTKEDRLSCLWFYCLAFLVPFVIILVAAFARKIAPFGENTLMAIDAWGQYFPMLREMKRAFRSFDTSYSFTGALGFDLTAQSAYYTNSPLWYLLFLLPGELTPSQVDMMVFIRFALAGLTFSYYLSSHYGKRSYPMIVFSLGYAFSGYTLAFINQFMWMDAVVFLPLVLLGIEKVYHGKGGVLLYTGSLFLTIYSNFYIAYAVCLFAVLWFFMLSFSEWKGIREWFLSAFRFGICSLVAGLLNLGVLLPLLRAIGNTLASEKGFGTQFKMYHSLSEMLAMLLPFEKSSLAFEAPNIYFGIIPAVLTVFALISKIPLKKKLSYAFLMIFMFVSFNFNLLDFIWHGFHFPNQLPGRQSFLFIFIGLVIAYQGFMTFLKEGVQKEDMRLFVTVILCALIGTEITANAIHKICADTRTVSVASVLRNDDALEEVRENYTSDKNKNEFWRVELGSHRYNGGQLYGYNGISHYSSTMSGACYKFFTQLGMSVYAKNVSIEYIPNPVLNSLFGVRYIVSEYDDADTVSENVGKAGYLYINENKAVLPLFYVGDKDTLNIDMSLQGHAFTNEIFKKISGSLDVIKGNGQFVDRQGEGYILNTEEFLKGIGNILESKTEIIDFGKTKIKGTVDSVKDGILIISLPAADIEIEIDGQRVETLTIAGYMAGAEISEGHHEITIKLP
ncbi:MAG: YfhO family protein [Clostridia bacterium]|nr:YfhO family protein [Clostridia bacterium]